jgi:hypothetical protein
VTKTFAARSANQIPQLDMVGLNYKLMGDDGASNIDPFAKGPTPDNEWVVTGPHVIIFVPDVADLWGAVVAGCGALLAGTTRFLGFGFVPYPLLYGGFVIPLSLWLAAMGVLMWRRTLAGIDIVLGRP